VGVHIMPRQSHVRHEQAQKEPGGVQRSCPKLAAVVVDPRGDTLAACDGEHDEGLLLCIHCGCWTSSRPVGLLHPCTGPAKPQSEGHKTLKRVAAGSHPQHGRGRLTSALVPISDEHTVAASEAIGRLLESKLESKLRASPVPTWSSCSGQGLSLNPADGQDLGITSAQLRLQCLRQRVVSRIVSTEQQR
jgi:hypothetical protein